jgi:hypothetical protein
MITARFRSALAMLALVTTNAVAQHRPRLPDTALAAVAGTWEVTAMIGPRDSVVARYGMVATATRRGWTVNLPNRPPLQARVLIVGGDSVVFEIGPFASILRAGETVTTRTVAHFKGDTMTGAIIARFSSGDSVVEKTTGKKRPKK